MDEEKTVEEEREEWLNSLLLPYNMKKSEMVKEKLFFASYPEKNDPASEEQDLSGLELDDSFLMDDV